MSVAIRPASEDDLAAMAFIRAQVWESEAYWLSRIGLYLKGEQSPQHALPLRQVFVAVEDGAVVGFVAGHLTRRYVCDGELQWIDVAKDHRRQGIAGMLISTIAAWFVQQHAFRVCVDVAPENSAARALYVKFGAQPLSEHWLVWQDMRGVTTQSLDAH